MFLEDLISQFALASLLLVDITTVNSPFMEHKSSSSPDLGSPKAPKSSASSEKRPEESHFKASCRVPKVRGFFEYTLNDWQLIPHHPGDVTISPAFSISKGDQWSLEVYPEGRDSHRSGNVTFCLRNVTSTAVRAGCVLKILGREHNEIVRETEPARCFSQLAEWCVDTGLTFSDINDKDSKWVHGDGSLHVLLDMTVCGKPESMHGIGLGGASTLLEPTGEPVPTLASDLVSLLDSRSAIVTLDSGPVIVSTEDSCCDMMWKADITLASENEKVSCHQCILAARSPVLCEKLQSGGTAMKMFLQSGKLNVTKHVHPSVLKNFVYFLYTDYCNEDFLLEDDGTHLCKLLQTACHYQVLGLVALCSQYLITTLAIENAATRLALVHPLKYTDRLQDAILHFIALNAPDVVKTDGFHQLDADVCRLVVEEINAPGIEREASREAREVESDETLIKRNDDPSTDPGCSSDEKASPHRYRDAPGTHCKTVFREVEGANEDPKKEQSELPVSDDN